MKFSELKNKIESYSEILPDYEDPEVVVAIKMPYSTVGGQPTVKVKSFDKGFDWDSGKFIFTPEEKLTLHNRDFAKEFRDLQEKCSRLMWEVRDLKAKIKKNERNE